MGKSGEPLYEKVKNTIIERINMGNYTVGQQLPSEAELVEEFSVSRITVTKALSILVSEGYIYRMQGKGSFVAQPTNRVQHLVPAAHNIKASADTTRKIGVLFPPVTDFHSQQFLHGITENLCFPDYAVTVAVISNAEQEGFALEEYLNNSYDALIIFPVDTEIYNEDILALHINKYPFVLIDRYFPGIGTSYVISDNTQGMPLAIQHLFSLHHEKIAFCTHSSAEEQNTKARLNAFYSTLSTKKIPFFPYQDMTNLQEDTKKLQELEELIVTRQLTAVITGSSNTCDAICALCQKHSVKIPEDLSVISYDRPYIAQNTAVPLFTCIEQPSYKMGKHAADIVKKMTSSSEGLAYPYQVKLPQSLVVGKSTAEVRHE